MVQGWLRARRVYQRMQLSGCQSRQTTASTAASWSAISLSRHGPAGSGESKIQITVGGISQTDPSLLLSSPTPPLKSS